MLALCLRRWLSIKALDQRLVFVTPQLVIENITMKKSHRKHTVLDLPEGQSLRPHPPHIVH